MDCSGRDASRLALERSSLLPLWAKYTTRTAARNITTPSWRIADDLKLELKPTMEDLNILTPDERNKVIQGLTSEERAIKIHPKEAALIRALSVTYLNSLVPSAMAEHGC